MASPSPLRSLALLALSAPLFASCAVFDPPPEPSIGGAVDGLLSDATAPLVIAFSEPIDEKTLHLEIARDELDIEGNLADERTPPGELSLLFQHTYGHIDDFGTSQLAADARSLVIVPSAAMPIGPRLVLLVEPGLADPEGNATVVRRHVSFGYSASLECDAPVANFPSSKVFLIVEVTKPIGAQIKLFGDMRIDAATGKLLAQFTAGTRDRQQQCPTPCDPGEACRLLPSPECVAPSTKAGTVDEFPDFVANPTPPTGYTFTATGCVADQPDGSVSLAIAPVDVVVQSPPVTLRNARMTASFKQDADGVVRGSGLLSADDVLLQANSSGRGEGELSARLLSEDEAPANLPEPPAP